MSRFFSLPSVITLPAAYERVSFGVANLPAKFSSMQSWRDVAYGSQPWQQLDIYAPAAGQSGNRPVIVFFYGGRWTDGHKRDYQFVAQTFVARGYSVVIPDYAKYPQVKFPVFVQDAAKALSWTFDHITGYGGDAGQIHVSGHSAGAHIAALAVADPRYLSAENKTPRQVIASFAGLSGPYAFTPDEPDLIDMFGPPACYPQMQVPTFITGQEPAMFLGWGDKDRTVGRFNLDRLSETIKAKGGEVESRIYSGGDHVGLVAALSWVNLQGIAVAEDLDRYFRQPRPR